MCILFIALKQHKDFPLILLANRDEYHERPTTKAGFWPEFPELLAGKDEKEGGTWLGLHTNGRVSALTNYRDMKAHREGRLSRGQLVKDYLLSDKEPESFLEYLQTSNDKYNPYNLFFGNLQSLRFQVYSNMNRVCHELKEGFHGLSNAHLNSDWPKIAKGLALVKDYILSENLEVEELFQLMQNTEKAPDHLLPDTGVGLENERFLSSIFIKSPVYGTRSTALVFLKKWPRKFL